MIEKILERLEASAEGAKDSKDLSKYSAYKQSIEIVQEVAKDGGWIPCSERLPEENGRFLVTDEDGILAVCRFVADGNEFRVCWDNEYFYDAIAWQPLPAPYQKGE